MLKELKNIETFASPKKQRMLRINENIKIVSVDGHPIGYTPCRACYTVN